MSEQDYVRRNRAAWDGYAAEYEEPSFHIEDLIEVRPPEGSTSRHAFAALEWSRRWPCDEVSKARKARS